MLGTEIKKSDGEGLGKRKKFMQEIGRVTLKKIYFIC